MSTVQWHYGTKVVLPRRVKADLADEALAAAILFGPLLLGQALVGSVPDLLLRVTIVAFPAAILYTVFRDAAGGGVSLGKRALGLTIIRLVDGRRCTARHVWARNLLDVVPIINVIDFIMMCVDRRGQKIMDRWLRLQVVEA
jgi:uncharacterized RDD family membrane protein YckC